MARRRSPRRGTYFVLKDGTHAVRFGNGTWARIKGKQAQGHARRVFGPPQYLDVTQKANRFDGHGKGINRTTQEVMGGLRRYRTGSGIQTGRTGDGTGNTGPRADRPEVGEGERQRRESAKANIRETLATFFGDGPVADSLADWAWDQIVEGRSENEVVLNLRQRQEYKDRFAGMEVRRANGHNAISEMEYIQYENDVRNLAQRAGISQEFINEYIPKFIGGNLSAREVADRISTGYTDMVSGAPEVMQELERLYNVSPGRMLEFWIDPQKGTDLIMRDYRTAQAAAAGLQSGFGQLSKTEAEMLDSMVAADGDGTLNEDMVRQGLSDLASQRELMQSLVGEAGESITREDQFGAVFQKDAGTLQRIRKTAEKRKAEFEGGGGAAANQFGVVGLGSGNV